MKLGILSLVLSCVTAFVGGCSARSQSSALDFDNTTSSKAKWPIGQSFYVVESSFKCKAQTGEWVETYKKKIWFMDDKNSESSYEICEHKGCDDTVGCTEISLNSQIKLGENNAFVEYNGEIFYSESDSKVKAILPK